MKLNNSLLANCLAMSETPTVALKSITFRPTPEDKIIIERMAAKLGIKTSQVIKIALRRLVESEGMKLRAS